MTRPPWQDTRQVQPAPGLTQWYTCGKCFSPHIAGTTCAAPSPAPLAHASTSPDPYRVAALNAAAHLLASSDTVTAEQIHGAADACLAWLTGGHGDPSPAHMYVDYLDQTSPSDTPDHRSTTDARVPYPDGNHNFGASAMPQGHSADPDTTTERRHTPTCGWEHPADTPCPQSSAPRHDGQPTDGTP